MTSLTDQRNSGQVQKFGYDWLDRLPTASTNAVGTGQYNHSYSYDAACPEPAEGATSPTWRAVPTPTARPSPTP